jgi:O-acetyl-ADP-ribose deacetylase (regulator of RNase III)
MGKIIHKTGDLFLSSAPALAHGVNTQGAMGSGVAVSFRERWPDMFEVYKELCASGDLEPGGCFVYGPTSEGVTIFNVASQERAYLVPGEANAKLEWLAAGLETALAVCAHEGFDTLAMPRIGAGLGGLDWESVEMLLNIMVPTGPVDVEVWTLP